MPCNTNIDNQKNSDCNPNIGQIIKAWLLKSKQTITLVNAQLEATFTALINLVAASRMYVLSQNPSEVTPDVGDAVMIEGNTNFSEKGKDGKQVITITYANIRLCRAQALKSLDGKTMYAFFITENEYVLGAGNTTNLVTNEVKLYVSEPKPAKATGGGWETVLRIELIPVTGIWINAIEEYNTNGWRPTQLSGISDVLFSNITADISAKTIIFDATEFCDGTDIVALNTVGDFKVTLESTGVEITLDSITWNGNTGTLAVNTGTPLTAFNHTIELRNQPTMTVKGYETRSAVVFLPI